MPTYNELENIKQLLPTLLQLSEKFDILVVDDSSPDGTAEYVKEFSKENRRIHLLLRSKKNGLGQAYIAGFNWGFENRFDCFVQMDADFSHDPRYLPLLLQT